MSKLKHTVNSDLIERTKELNCLYRVEDLFSQTHLTLEELMNSLLLIIPTGFRFPETIQIRIKFFDKIYHSTKFKESNFKIENIIKAFDESFGKIEVFSSESDIPSSQNPFLQEETQLLTTISDRVGHFAIYLKVRGLFHELKELNDELTESHKPEWLVILDMLKKTDQNLYSILSRKMLNHLFCKGVRESTDLFKKLGSNIDYDTTVSTEINRPSKKTVLMQSFKFGHEIFKLASRYFSDEDIIQKIQKWIHEEKSHILIKLLANQNSSLTDLADAIRRYHSINPGGEIGATPTRHGIVVALIRRFLTEQLEFIDIAKNYFWEEDFYYLLQKLIFPAESHGKIGGKGAGLLLARKIIEKSNKFSDALRSVRFPKTWYITSDGLTNFMYYNNMEDVLDQKYKDIDEIRQEYPHIIQAFKNSNFSPEIMNGLSRALDDFGDNPIIVRSSSLLEDRLGSAFAGKYKSLFLANQGPKQQRMEELLDAISEVYASTFGPDPIGYRTEKGLLDYNEEMAILIQEVVGVKKGKYFFPAFSGVAFSNNEFRWSPRIEREDGLIRMVPGLGTRAVDRIGDDFPMLLAPGKPNLRVNQTFQEIVGYAPKFIDVMNLNTNTFETISVDDLIREIGNDYPMLNEIFSIVDGRNIKRPIGLGIDTRQHDIIATFDNLINGKKYIEQIYYMMVELKDKLDTPVDIEFACDGKNIYLLQCRPQSSSGESVSAIIPTDVPQEKVLFTANKFVSNGKVPDIAFIVYVDPLKYSKLEKHEDLLAVGLAVGKLNKMLPKKNFILMGPGRWGSRDEIKLGVKVTYSDIHNCAVLIEIAKQQENYTPELSFGTHFFQDLVEAGIRYLPLYPDNENQEFNWEFFNSKENTLTRFLPEFEHIADVLKVINVRESTAGSVARVLLNADMGVAMCLLADSSISQSYTANTELVQKSDSYYDEPLQWRKRMAESLALKMDAARFGVKGVYLFGTVFNETASANSDIDLLVHFEGSEDQRRELNTWFEGWNHCLSQINYNRSGYYIEKFLDITYISEKDFKDQKYYVDLMDSANHSSRKLSMG
ncbi:MAG: pyruvate, phosphate dikinase [Candidatus Kapabacteria bacterium]|nr:pyruvate, phosphate dikinase [Ignavibacteriota bacterium]MCW5883378.1 pyruvate, phosphate dikinase [Candidatus Kapabacteria bacterium]